MSAYGDSYMELLELIVEVVDYIIASPSIVVNITNAVNDIIDISDFEVVEPTGTS
jgi:hypothetical protein